MKKNNINNKQTNTYSEMSSLKWDIMAQVDIRFDQTKVGADELRYRNQSFLDLYEGDSDLGQFLTFLLLRGTEQALSSQPVSDNPRHQMAMIEGRILVLFQTVDLIYPSVLEGRYQITGGTGSRRSLVTFSYRLAKTQTRCTPLGQALCTNPGAKQVCLAIISDLKENYNIAIQVSPENVWTFVTRQL